MSTTDEILNIVSGLSTEKRGTLLAFARFLDSSDDGITDNEATEEIENDPEMLKNLRQGAHEIASGKTYSWESVR